MDEKVKENLSNGENDEQAKKILKKDVEFSRLDKKKVKKEKKTINEMTKEEYKKKKKKRGIIILIIITVIVLLLFLSTIFSILNVGNENIIKGISIAGIDVSGMSKKEATEKLESIYNEKKEKDITLKYGEYEATINPKLIEVEYGIEKAVDEACLTGRKGNIITNNYEILATLISNKKIDIEMSLNEEITKQTIEDIGVNLPGIVEESSYSVEENELLITKGKTGIKIDVERMLEKIKENLITANKEEDIIKIEVITKKPEEIDLEKIHKEVYKEVKDAYYTKEPFAVYPEVEGVDFDIEEAKKILEEEKEEYVIKLKITKPKVTLSQIGSEAFQDRLSVFTTRYDASDVDRTTNLKIACQKINGKVILSGDTFSYNETLGARTVEAGFRNGKIYSGGKVVDGIGGGICQISSTLYNAVVMANLEIVERRNHQFVTSYLPAGRDATVVYGLTDFKFKNTRKYPVRLVASCQNGIATISVYGIKEETEYTFSFNTKTISTIPMTTRYIDDPNLEEGTEVIEQKGTTGLKTETYLTKMLNGKVISTTLLSRDTYSSMERIVKKGTKKVNKPQTNTTTTQTNKQTTNNVEPHKEENNEQTGEEPKENEEIIEPEGE